MNNLWDVIIVGAGPSGSTLGYELGSYGLRVVILDKEKFPRYKPCGGGLTIKTVNQVGKDLTSIYKDTILNTYVTYRLQDEHLLSSPTPIAYTVNRNDFDYFLVQNAKEAGCSFIDGEKVRGVEVDDNIASVFTDKQKYTGKIVVGADGANGVIAKSVGLMQDTFIGVSIESEVEVNSIEFDRWNNTVQLDLGSVIGGYGWVFPKKDHLSIGVAGPQDRAENVQAYFKSFSNYCEKNMRGYHLIQKRGHRLPVKRKGTSVQRGRVLLVGDAAGLTEPLSGEGIYYAVYSGQLAARAIVAFLENPVINSLDEYQRFLDSELMPEIQRAKAYVKLFNLFPQQFFKLLVNRKRLWRATCGFLQGTKTFVEIGKKLGPLEFLLDQLAW